MNLLDLYDVASGSASTNQERTRCVVNLEHKVGHDFMYLPHDIFVLDVVIVLFDVHPFPLLQLVLAPELLVALYVVFAPKTILHAVGDLAGVELCLEAVAIAGHVEYSMYEHTINAHLIQALRTYDAVLHKFRGALVDAGFALPLRNKVRLDEIMRCSLWLRNKRNELLVRNKDWLRLALEVGQPRGASIDFVREFEWEPGQLGSLPAVIVGEVFKKLRLHGLLKRVPESSLQPTKKH